MKCCVAVKMQNMNEFSSTLGSVHEVVTTDLSAVLKTQI